MMQRNIGPLIWVLLVAVATGIAVSTLTSVLMKLPANTESVAPFALGYLLAANALLVSILLVVSIIYADSRRARQKMAARMEERTRQLLHHLHNIFSTRTGLSAYLLRSQYGKAGDLDGCIRESSDYLKLLTDETRVAFEDYTNNACAVSIKLLVPSKSGNLDKPEISTYIRDSKSQFIRRNLYGKDGRYPYEDHSPFVDIILGKDGRDYYLCNDLRKAASEGTYRNGNKHWHKLYNATVIIAIREPGIASYENILGFLCVDSMDAKFDETVLLYLGRIIANTVFYVISSLSVLESQIASEKKAV